MESTPLEAIAEATTDTAALISAGAALSRPQKNPDPDGLHYVVIPEGYEIQYGLPTAQKPPRPKALVRLRDTASFIRYFNDHKAPRSRVYASMEPASFLAVFDEFLDSDGVDDNIDETADWREFRASFEVPASREWKLWHKANKTPMGQLAFAEFLQDNLPDVVTPDGTELLEMALKFEASQSGSFIAAQRLQDGSHNLAWKADNNASGSVKLPEQITLSIPVFENDEPTELHARLRYRVKEGTLTLWYELIRPHKVLEAAFRETWARIENDAGAVILLGSPE